MENLAPVETGSNENDETDNAKKVFRKGRHVHCQHQGETEESARVHVQN